MHQQDLNDYSDDEEQYESDSEEIRDVQMKETNQMNNQNHTQKFIEMEDDEDEDEDEDEDDDDEEEQDSEGLSKISEE